MSLTVPLDGCTIVATATVVILFSPSADCPGSAAPLCCGSVCVAMSCCGGFSPGGDYDSVWDSVKPMAGKFLINYFQYQEFVGSVCMLNFGFSSNVDICPDNYNYSRFKLKDKCAPHPGPYGPEGPLQWHFQGWFSWFYCTSRCVVWYGKAGIAGDSAPRAVFPSLSSGS